MSFSLGAMRSPLPIDFTLPKPAQDLLDNGSVLAFSIRMHLKGDGVPSPTWDGSGYACIPTEDGCAWLWGWQSIEEQTHLPTLPLALISLTQPYPISAWTLQRTWEKSGYPEFGGEPYELDITFLPSGAVVGMAEITDVLKRNFDEIHLAQDLGTLDELVAKAATQDIRGAYANKIADLVFPGPYLCSLLFHPPEGNTKSAHSAMTLLPQAERLMADWVKTMPTDPDKPWMATLPYGLPTLDDLMRVL